MSELRRCIKCEKEVERFYSFMTCLTCTLWQRFPDRKPCLHCGVNPHGRSKALCVVCYKDLGIRWRYSKKRERQENANKPGGLPEPTEALPGTEEKIEVLADRVAKRQVPWHPEDRMDSF